MQELGFSASSHSFFISGLGTKVNCTLYLTVLRLLSLVISNIPPVPGFSYPLFVFLIEFSPRHLRESGPCTCARVPRLLAGRLIFEVSYIQYLTSGPPAHSSSSVFPGGGKRKAEFAS